MKKGTDYPQGQNAGNTSSSAVFTDGNNYANTFVKELYIEDKWSYEKQYGELYLYYAVLNGTSSAPYICIAPRKGKGAKAIYYQLHNLSAIRCSTNGVVKLEGDGLLSGVEAYIVADWQTLWDMPASQTGLKDGKIIFNAKINTSAASNPNNSPRISAYMEYERKRHISNEYSGISEESIDNFAPNKAETFGFFNASNAEEFSDIVSQKSFATINLKGDIKASGIHKSAKGKKSLFVIPNGKTVNIIGNGHVIYEYGESSSETTINADNVYGEAFTDANGNVHPLAQSEAYIIQGWEENKVTDSNGKEIYHEACGIKVSEDFINKFNNSSEKVGNKGELEDLYISLQLSWTRTVHKATKFINGIIYFSPASLNGMNAKNENYDRYLRADANATGVWTLTEQPTFFLINTNMDHEGVVIKGGKVVCPASYPKLWRCKASRLFVVEKGGTLHIENATLHGGKETCMQNYGNLWLDNCKISNPLGYGIYSHGQTIVEKSEFRDIRTSGIWHLTEDTDDRWKAEAPGEDWPRMSVTDSKFVNIGHYGTNDFAIKNESVAYIARNEIIDSNYGAIWTGNLNNNVTGKTLAFLPAFMGFIECNYIHFTDEWVEKRKILGLRDSGYIYIAPNNGKAVVRLNRLERCGGRKWNNAIYADDGAYNTKIYCNIVSGTENRFDIDFRDLSSRPEHQHAKVEGTYVNTGNTISLNYCEGFVRIEDNAKDENISNDKKLLCQFKDNVVLGIKTPGGNNPDDSGNGNTINYKHGSKSEVVNNERFFVKTLPGFINGKIEENKK